VPVSASEPPIRIGGCASVTGATADASAARRATVKTLLALVTGAGSAD
jgi:hypothetical protein